MDVDRRAGMLGNRRAVLEPLRARLLGGYRHGSTELLAGWMRRRKRERRVLVWDEDVDKIGLRRGEVVDRDVGRDTVVRERAAKRFG